MIPEDYLQIDGEIIAMTGSSVTHGRIYLNLYLALRPHLERRGGDASVADVKVQDAKNKRCFYPDLAVTCHANDRKNNQFIAHPTVIVEVLSPSNFQ